MKLASILLSIVSLAARSFAQEPVSPDDNARFLAGLPVRNSALEGLSRNPAWVDHAIEFDRAWKELDAKQLAKVRTWSGAFLPDASASKAPMFYMFSGPDILYAQAFFPNASTYVLAAREPIGPVPDVTHLPPGTLFPSLGNLHKALNSVLSFSFFITKDMKTDLQNTRLSGTLPLLYVFLERAGCKLDTVELVGLDKAGELTKGKASTPGVKITFFGPSGAQQTLYYFETDLSNEGVKSQPGFLKFCENLGPGHSLVKAASYLMHLSDFTAVRDFLLTHSDTIVQDDSGIPVKDFDAKKWVLRYFGNYPGPIDIFKQHTQPDLAMAYNRSHPPSLPFGFGYRWHPSQSSLILATRRSNSSSNSPENTSPTNPATIPKP